MEKTNKLTVIEKFELPILSNDMKDIMQEEMDGMTLTFERVRIPSGGGIVFEIPGDDPENPDVEKEIIGVIVDKHPVNAYWKDKYTGENNPPDCSALDGRNGIGNPGGECRMCPLNQWGSGHDEKGESTSGKECKNMHRIYIQRAGELFPLLLTLPPTSLQNFSGYVAKRLLTRGLRTYEVVTKITLKKAVSKGGITYSQAAFQFVGKLSKAQAEQMAIYSNEIKATTRQIDVFTDEIKEDNSKGSDLLDDLDAVEEVEFESSAPVENVE